MGVFPISSPLRGKRRPCCPHSSRGWLRIRPTVKKYATAEHAEQLIHGPKYATTLVDPFRDYLRKRRAIEPGVATWTLLGEIKAMGYQGGSTLLYRYLGQGRADGEHPQPSPRRLTTNPAKLTPTQQTHLEHTLNLKRCPELQAVVGHVRSFAALLTADHDGNLDEHTAHLDAWIDQVRADQQAPALRSFAEGLLIGHDAVAAALALPYSNGSTEGIVDKIIMLTRPSTGPELCAKVSPLTTASMSRRSPLVKSAGGAVRRRRRRPSRR